MGAHQFKGTALPVLQARSSPWPPNTERASPEPRCARVSKPRRSRAASTQGRECVRLSRGCQGAGTPSPGHQAGGGCARPLDQVGILKPTTAAFQAAVLLPLKEHLATLGADPGQEEEPGAALALPPLLPWAPSTGDSGCCLPCQCSR